MQAEPAVRQGLTVLVTLGVRATSVERWDGSVRVTGGRLLTLEGRQFSAGDEILPPDRWKCSTRRDELPPYSDTQYNEIHASATAQAPSVLFHPVGLWIATEGPARLAIETAQGRFEFGVEETSTDPVSFLDGRVEVRRVPTVEKLSTPLYEDDEPSLVAHRDGSLSTAWVAYLSKADRVLVRTWRNGVWSAPEEVTPEPADVFRTAAAEDAQGNLWVFWSQREQVQWHILARQKRNGQWQPVVRLTETGSNMFHRVGIFAVWQSFRNGQSDIYVRAFDAAKWSPELRVSESPANDWEPAVAAAPDGSVFIAWDNYEKGNYDVLFRSWRDGRLSELRSVASSALFEAHATVAADAQSRPWVAWDSSGVNWGKDVGFMYMVPVPSAVPLHQQRNIGVAVLSNGQWLEPQAPFGTFPDNAEHPQLAFDGSGTLNMMFRHWTRRNSRYIGSPMSWENYLTRWNGVVWSPPQPLNHSAGSIEKNPALARQSNGDLWAAWMTDERPFSRHRPVNGEIYCARLGSSSQRAQPSDLVLKRSPRAESIPVHPTEEAALKAMRTYTIDAAGRKHKIFRGDMHRHTDISFDFKYDGSLIEVYRYGLDVAAFDYIAPTDHESGTDQEFTWWQGQKLADLFFLPDRFTPLFAYERSLSFPNGHRNVVFAHRGVQPLPIPREERSGKEGAGRLYRYLRQNRGISMPHSSATDQGTNWRDNDPEVEPLMEIYQGYRTSYEYEGAPRAASSLIPQAQKSGWQPSGFWWNALAKGYRIGVQASSDHWSTHMSYACLIAENHTREGLLDAIRRRHSYGATDNIVLDYRLQTGGRDYLQGDIVDVKGPFNLWLRVLGTAPIRQVDIIKNQAFLHNRQALPQEVGFTFVDTNPSAGESYYYVRVIQIDGQLAWSSPIWVRR
jgi:hypothetical protein